MNTYVMGEIATLLAVSVLAGILIGWCIKSLLAGRKERKVRSYVARDVDDAMADVEQMRAALDRKDDQLRDVNVELQKMRGRDISMKAGNTTQVDEINKLKNELAVARQSLDRNRTEFNAFRNDKQQEMQSLNNKLSSFQAGGPIHDERMVEANETISALRNATRENDRVIESLRARVKEGDTTVENLRNQLKSAESSASEYETTRKTAEESVGKLNVTLKEVTAERDQLKRDYDVTLSNKNSEITRLQGRIEELGTVQTSLKAKEHELGKLNQQVQDNASRAGDQIAELKQTIANKEAERAAYLKDQKRMQQQLASLQAENGRLMTQSDQEVKALKSRVEAANQELTSATSLKTQVENKSAEVVALNDMLRDVSNKRNELQARVTKLEKQLHASGAEQQEHKASQRKLADVTATLHERDSTLAKLRSEFDTVVAARNELSAETGSLQNNNSKLRRELDEVVESRNRVSIELGELQSSKDRATAEIKGESEKQLSQMVVALKERDQSFEKLRKDMDEMTVTRDRLTAELQKLQNRGAELETFKSDMQTAVANRDSELEQRKTAYQKLQEEFNQLTKVRSDYEARINSLKGEVQEQAKKLQDQERHSKQEIDKLQPQVAELRSKLSLADSENQKISSELSDAAALRLAVTEKESVIQKLQIDLQDARLNSNGVDQNAQSKLDSLTMALKDRDTEISRLNSALTDNRVSSKQSASEINLLKQEVDSQSKLIKGLEEQSENTLTLHKKIAAQSTEIEDLRARLYQGEEPADRAEEITSLKSQLQQQNGTIQTLTQQLNDSQKIARDARAEVSSVTQSSSNDSALKDQISQLQNQLNSRNAEVRKLQQDSQAYARLQTQHQQLQREHESTKAQVQSAKSQVAARQQAPSATTQANTGQTNTAQAKTGTVASSKPRVFLRPDNKPASTESLTGVAGNYQARGKATYTRDGYRIKRMDGHDDLTLLPGIGRKAEQELNKHGVTEFEQIALWGNREVMHFAERSGITVAKAESYNWPKLAREILQGTYRRAEFMESDGS
jgi:chromosome segregation ATPase